MLRRLHVQGYRALRDVDLVLGPLNVLIGPNGCGKTSLLDVFVLLREYATGKLEDAVYARGGMDGVLWARGEYESVSIELISTLSPQDQETYWAFRLRLRKSGTTFAHEIALGPDSFENLSVISASDVFRELIYPKGTQGLKDMLGGSLVYTDFDTTHDSPVRQPPLVRPQTRLVNGGDNLVNVLYHLSSVREYRPAYEDMLDVIRTAYPDFDELAFPPEGGDGRIVMRWKEKSFKRDFSTHYLSDGILRFLCLLVILKTPDPPPLVCIDEPELGLHPSLMPIVAALLRDAASRTQLVVATHSPQLVDALDVEHIVIMERVDGETRVQRLQDRPHLDAWLEHYSKGELWLSGELGGVPW